MTRPDIKLPLRIKRVCLDEAMGGSFGIVDATGQTVGYFYFGPPDEGSRGAAKLLTEADAEVLVKIAARAIMAAYDPQSPVTHGDSGDNPAA